MPDNWWPLTTRGAWRRKVEVHNDERGSLGEIWRAQWIEELPEGIPMRQANVSRSRTGILRGLHMHLRQSDLWVILDGHPFIALVDVRPVVAEEGAPTTETFDGGPGDVLYIPQGVAHGFLARDPTTLVYFVTHEYDGGDEMGLAWNDVTAGVDWPIERPTLSERDRRNPSLHELVRSVRQHSSAR